MSLNSIVSLLVITLLLAACAGQTTTPPIVVTQNPAVPSPTSSTPIPYPYLAVGTPAYSIPAYPEPGTPGTGGSIIPPSGYEPKPGDAKLTRDQVFLDVQNSSVGISDSMPVQVSVTLNGSLSDPCHQLRVVVTPANAQNQIYLNVYSVFDPSMMCITVIQPFSVTIPVGSYVGGNFMVYVNGQLLGETN